MYVKIYFMSSDSNVDPGSPEKALSKDEIINTEMNTYSCGICDESFADSDVYIIHVWSHCPDLVEVCVKNVKVESSEIDAISRGISTNTSEETYRKKGTVKAWSINHCIHPPLISFL